MPRLPFIVAAILPLAMCPIIACENDDNAAPTFFSPEAGAFDSSTPPTDSAAPPVTNTVTVTVLGDDGPRSDVLVVFHDASGAVVETKKTGPDGKASSTGATPSMASALLSRSTERNIVTWTAIEAGDDLTVNDFDFFTDRGSYDVSLPGLFAGAVRYNARVADCTTNGSAWNGETAKSIPLRAGCVRAQNAVLVDAFDGDNHVLAHAFAKNIAPAGNTPLAVSVGNFATPTDVVVSQMNGPAETSGFVELAEIVGDVTYPSFGAASDLPPVTFRTATGFSDALQASAYLSASGGTALVLSRRVATPVPAGSFSFDFAGALPLVTHGTTEVTDPRRPVMTWTSAAPTTGADGGFVRFMEYLGGDTQLTWTLIVPPGATSVKAPALPAEADAWLPVPDASMGSPFLDVVFVESDLVPNYAAFRRQQGTLFRSSAFDSIPALHTNGTLSISRWGNAG